MAGRWTMVNVRGLAAAAICAGIMVAAPGPVRADSLFSGDWSLSLGAAVFTAPDYEGGRRYLLRAAPIISLGRQGTITKFSSRNDNISLAFVDTGSFRAGATGKILFGRDGSDSRDLAGLDRVEWGAEAGGFAEFYPTDWRGCAARCVTVSVPTTASLPISPPTRSWMSRPPSVSRAVRASKSRAETISMPTMASRRRKRLRPA